MPLATAAPIRARLCAKKSPKRCSMWVNGRFNNEQSKLEQIWQMKWNFWFKKKRRNRNRFLREQRPIRRGPTSHSGTWHCSHSGRHTSSEENLQHPAAVQAPYLISGTDIGTKLDNSGCLMIPAFLLLLLPVASTFTTASVGEQDNYRPQVMEKNFLSNKFLQYFSQAMIIHQCAADADMPTYGCIIHRKNCAIPSLEMIRSDL